MTYTVCQVEVLTLLRTKLDEPGVLKGPQRMPEFVAKIMMVATTMVTRQTKAVRELARLGVRHRFPFAHEKTAKLCGVVKDTIPRVLEILLEVGFLAEKSETKRWYEVGSLRSITPGAKAYWRRPSIYQFSDKIACILTGTDFAASPYENQSALEVIPSVQRMELDDYTDQIIEEVEEIDLGTVQRALPPIGFDDDADDAIGESTTGFDDDVIDDDVITPPEVSRSSPSPSLPSGPKISTPVRPAAEIPLQRVPMSASPLPKIPMPVITLPTSARRVVEERPQPEPTPVVPNALEAIIAAWGAAFEANAKRGG